MTLFVHLDFDLLEHLNHRKAKQKASESFKVRVVSNVWQYKLKTYNGELNAFRLNT